MEAIPSMTTENIDFSAEHYESQNVFSDSDGCGNPFGLLGKGNCHPRAE